ncbi:hypothetical protein KFU94_15960 [Chloroflexi bacterium TSY]|nr:hypothetical protein [Chloroflexi bacterium TSY]
MRRGTRLYFAAEIVAVKWNRLSTSTALSKPVSTVEYHLRIPTSEIDVDAAGIALSRLLAQPATPPRLVQYAVGGFGNSSARQTNAAEVPVPQNWPFGSGNFRWPAYGWLSQGYHASHRAIDIAAPVGTLVTAADRGVVLRSGWNAQGYGAWFKVKYKYLYN